MAQVEINHSFVTVKPDSADDTLVSADEWNDELVFTNGVNGQVIVRDDAEDTGARWTQGTRSVQTQGNAGGVTTSLPLAASPITFTTSSLLMLIVYVNSTTSAGQVCNIALRRDTVNLATPNWNGTGIGGVAFINVYNEAAGTHTYDLVFSVTSGTITSVTTSLVAVIIGT